MLSSEGDVVVGALYGGAVMPPTIRDSLPSRFQRLRYALSIWRFLMVLCDAMRASVVGDGIMSLRI